MKMDIYLGKPHFREACAIGIYLAAYEIRYSYPILIVLWLRLLAHGRQLQIVSVAGAGYSTASEQAGSQKNLN